MREREREIDKVGWSGVSMKKSPGVVLTPDVSSQRESFCPLRLVSALLLLMLLLLRRFGMLRRERQTGTEKEREGEVVGERKK